MTSLENQGFWIILDNNIATSTQKESNFKFLEEKRSRFDFKGGQGERGDKRLKMIKKIHFRSLSTATALKTFSRRSFIFYSSRT